MRISKRGEYGLRAMILLASNQQKNGVMQIKAIAAAERIPVKFLEQILLALKNAGILHSKMGIGGGYALAKPANEIMLGKIIRIRPDGSVPPDNPFVQNKQGKPEIWSYGHRSVQGAAIHPQTGELWIHEHGPKGGDEINIPQPGKNYGWPKASYGSHYSGVPIKDEHTEQGFEEPIYYWTPSIAPCGMTFYTGSLFPGWRGSVFVGALAGRQLVRLSTDDKRILGEEKLLNQTTRFRDVVQGPDGALYLLTDEENGKLLKLIPKVFCLLSTS